MRKITVPYLVSICSYPSEAKKGLCRYLESVDNLGSFELILISYSPFDSYPVIQSPALRTYNFMEPYPGNLHRFDFLYDLAMNEMDPDRWIVFTDTHDVMFQAPLPDFSVFNDNKVLIASEGEKWGESTWFPILQEKVGVPFIKQLADREIVNAGTWAMNVKTFRDMYRFMIKRAEDYGNHPWSDQPIYNEFLYSERVTPFSHPTFCTVLYKNMELGNVVKEGNKFYNRNQDLYSIVHGNGSSKEYFDD